MEKSLKNRKDIIRFMMKGRTLRAIGTLAVLGIAAGVLAQGTTLDAVKNNIKSSPAEWKVVVGAEAQAADVIGAADIVAAIEVFNKQVTESEITPKVTLESAELTYEEFTPVTNGTEVTDFPAKGESKDVYLVSESTKVDTSILTGTKQETKFLSDYEALDVAYTASEKEGFGKYIEFSEFKYVYEPEDLTFTKKEENGKYFYEARITLFGNQYYLRYYGNNTWKLVSAYGYETIEEGVIFDLSKYGYSGYSLKVENIYRIGTDSYHVEIALLDQNENELDREYVTWSGTEEKVLLRDEANDKTIEVYVRSVGFKEDTNKYLVSISFQAGTINVGDYLDVDEQWKLSSISEVTSLIPEPSAASSDSVDNVEVRLVVTWEGWDKYSDYFTTPNKVVKLGEKVVAPNNAFEVVFADLYTPETYKLKVSVYGTDKAIVITPVDGGRMFAGSQELSYLKIDYPELKTVTVKVWDNNTTAGDIDIYANVTGIPAGWKVEIYVNGTKVKELTTDAKNVLLQENLSAAVPIEVKVYDYAGILAGTNSDNLSDNGSVDLSVSKTAVKVAQAKDKDGNVLDAWEGKYITKLEVYKDSDDKVKYVVDFDEVDTSIDRIYVNDTERDSVTITVDETGSNAITDATSAPEFEGSIGELVKYKDNPDYVLLELPIDKIRYKVYFGTQVAGTKETRELKEGDIVYVEGKKYVVKEIEKAVSKDVTITPLVGSAILDTEVTPEDTKLIVVGGPAVNRIAADFLGVEYPTYGRTLKEMGILAEDEALIKVVERGGSVAVLVFGWSADDTRAAARKFAEYLLGNLEDETPFIGATEVKLTKSGATYQVEKVQ